MPNPPRQDMELHRDMQQVSCCSNGKGAPQFVAAYPSKSTLLALLPASSKQHIPIASSPLNPDLCESNLKYGRHVRGMRKLRPVTRKGPEISPGLWLLRRKAALAHQRTKQSPPSPLRSHPVVAPRTCPINTAHAEENDITENWGDAMPTLISDSGPTPMVHILQWDFHPGDVTADLEKQAEPDAVLSRLSQEPWHHRRLRFFLMLCFMSASATFFTVLGFDTLSSSSHTFAR